jgi:hypothetical protein
MVELVDKTSRWNAALIAGGLKWHQDWQKGYQARIMQTQTVMSNGDMAP